MNNEQDSIFPLSKTKKTKGTRRLAREKVLQILVAYYVSEGTSVDILFKNIFSRQFNFGDQNEKIEKLLNKDEIYELEADIPIQWKEEELAFGKKLLISTIEKKDYIDILLKEFADNWEIDRIALIDRCIMQQTVTELMLFEEIPTKVSINEAIEIAKKYSTNKSGTFINGVLDSVLNKLKKEEKIKKTGRGLIE